MKQCNKCKNKLEEYYFPTHYYKNRVKLKSFCYKCYSISRKKTCKKYYDANSKIIAKKANDRYFANLDMQKEKSRKYRENNKELIKSRRLIALKEKLKNNPEIKIRLTMSRRIRQSMFKNKESFMKHSGFSISELKNHIESLFEPWMNWDNYGKYFKDKWNDNDTSTWTWQLDHIIPHSEFKYDSYEHPDFKKCWDLNNLRPLSSKQNLIDGLNRTRHSKGKNAL